MAIVKVKFKILRVENVPINKQSELNEILDRIEKNNPDVEVDEAEFIIS